MVTLLLIGECDFLSQQARLMTNKFINETSRNSLTVFAF